ncbi:MAG: EamA family transporter [Acidimicrobiia bacterium]|nr:EamA family transporter [Acidimicrobiia bacterium]
MSRRGWSLFLAMSLLWGVPYLMISAWSLGIAAVAYTPVGVMQWPSGAVSVPLVLSIVGLVLICTATAFVVYHKLVAEVGAVRSTVITYVNPAVALLLGVVVLGEKLTPVTVLGFALILIGSRFATERTRNDSEKPNVAPPHYWMDWRGERDGSAFDLPLHQPAYPGERCTR